MHPEIILRARSALDPITTLDDLGAADLSPDAVRDRCPGAVEYTGLDGSPCWRREELVPLTDGGAA